MEDARLNNEKDFYEGSVQLQRRSLGVSDYGDTDAAGEPDGYLFHAYENRTVKQIQGPLPRPPKGNLPCHAVLAPYLRPISRISSSNSARRTAGAVSSRPFLPSIAGGERDPAGRDVLVNLALSWEGLKAVGAFDAIGGDVVAAAAFYIFNDAPDPASLRVAGSSAPEHWWCGRFRIADIHLVLHLHVSTDADLQDVTARMRALALSCDATELFPNASGEAITGRQIEDRRLHFSYVDGISHPDVNCDDPARSHQLPRADFLLGYQGGNRSTYPDEPPFVGLFRDRSLVAFMQMYQDVATFNRFLREKGPVVSPASSQGDAEEYLTAKLMGR